MSANHTQNLINRLDIRTKLAGLALILILSFLFQNPLYNLALLFIVSLWGIILKISYKKVSGLILPLLPVLVFMVIISGVTHSPAQFFSESSHKVFYVILGTTFAVSTGGIFLGLTLIVRLLTMVLSSFIFSSVISTDELIQLMQKLNVPYEISFMITTALRFIPTLDRKRLQIFEAQKARGVKVNEKGMIGAVRSHIPIMVPMIFNAIIMADTLPMAMLNRGYGYTRSWTNLQDIALTKIDYVVNFIFLGIGMAGLYLRFVLRMGIL